MQDAFFSKSPLSIATHAEETEEAPTESPHETPTAPEEELPEEEAEPHPDAAESHAADTGAGDASAASGAGDAADGAVSGSCDRCEFADAETVMMLSSRLLATLATGVVLRGLSPADAMAELRELLLSPPSSQQASKKGTAGLVLLEAALKKLEAKRSLLGHFVSHAEDKVAARARDLELAGPCGSSARQQLAIQLVRHFDRTSEWHCGCDLAGMRPEQREQHVTNCIFRPVGCSYVGCTAIFSARFEDAHDHTCEYKVVRCTLACDKWAPRREMAAHVEGPCPMKPVSCPYHSIGCDAPLLQGGVEAHLAATTDFHLRLSVGRLLEQSREISNLRAAEATRAAAEAVGAAAASATQSGVGELRKRLEKLEGGTAALQKSSKASAAQAKRAEDAAAAAASRLAKLERELKDLQR